jgi:hypothetical protein
VFITERLTRGTDELFTYTRHFPVNAKRTETGHGRTTTWTLRAREATDVIRQDWPGVSWVIELVVTGTRKGKRYRHVHYFVTQRHEPAHFGKCLAAPGATALEH